MAHSISIYNSIHIPPLLPAPVCLVYYQRLRPLGVSFASPSAMEGLLFSINFLFYPPVHDLTTSGPHPMPESRARWEGNVDDMPASKEVVEVGRLFECHAVWVRGKCRQACL